jgi:uncharacterized membrane protein
MNRILTLAGIIAVTFNIGWSHEAKADLIFCNRSERPIYMALSKKSTANLSPQVVVKGWWYARSGQCQLVYTESLKPQERYGYYAIADNGKKRWGGDRNSSELCIGDDGFDLSMTESNTKNIQCNSPRYPVRFQWLETEGRPSITFDFS